MVDKLKKIDFKKENMLVDDNFYIYFLSMRFEDLLQAHGNPNWHFTNIV